jgi:hypothetical protein
VSAGTARIIQFPTQRRQPRKLVNVAELQELFGGSERWWRYRIAEGMPTHRWGRRLRFDPVEVENWMGERYGAA